ncbi:sensor histidine kinase [Persicobacter diffluens]|uniref:Signal transduction histidine kinase internal region domain-containing protein n=1 Tax=Persicobacter diffluens TaxID=981 RepID=A0AAN5AJZ8_9BACT|nr:hypothetical protein PEDI_20760 [Persicobacter diffluens]
MNLAIKHSEKLRWWEILVYLGLGLGYGLMLVSFYSQRLPWELSYKKAMMVIIAMGLVTALNVIWLIPAYMHKGKWAIYFVLTVILILLISYLHEKMDRNLMMQYIDELSGREKRLFRGGPPPHMRKIFRFAFFGQYIQFALVLLLSTSYEMTKFAMGKAREALKLREETLQSELNFLKSQINPHFLFNALNNIYTLAYLKSDKAPELILKLSDMLRYILYDCKEERVEISKEIQYLEDYIALQQLKSEEPLNVEVNFGLFAEEMMVPPMIFIPFVENAFKHSKIEDRQHGWVKIQLHPKESGLAFEVENSIPQKDFTKDQVGGIGLHNVARRLELLYPQSHQLEIVEQEDRFRVRLQLKNNKA